MKPALKEELFGPNLCELICISKLILEDQQLTISWHHSLTCLNTAELLFCVELGIRDSCGIILFRNNN